jgi:hypothetical protein
MLKEIDIGRDFSETPAGRFPSDGEFNGEAFRKILLVPALKRGGVVRVILDNTEGYGSSFLEEAFGGLIRLEGFDKDDVLARLQLVANTKRAERYKRLADKFIKEALAEHGR